MFCRFPIWAAISPVLGICMILRVFFNVSCSIDSLKGFLFNHLFLASNALLLFASLLLLYSKSLFYIYVDVVLYVCCDLIVVILLLIMLLSDHVVECSYFNTLRGK